MNRSMIVCAAAILGAVVLVSEAEAQLRVVNWNTATGTSSPGYAGRQTDFNRVLDFIGREEVNGIAKPIDVLILQEQSDVNTTLASFAAEMNTITGTSNYVAWSQNPFGSDGLDTGFVYNSATVTPFLEDWFGTGSSRATSRIGLDVNGYSNADFYIYNTHHTAGTGSGDLIERRDEAWDIRLNTSLGNTNAGNSGVPFNSDSLAADANIIYSGDFNQKTSTEEPAGDPFAWINNPYEILKLTTELGTSGNGQAVDPINRPGSWTNNAGFADIHTQSPHDGSFGLVGGGMDDRFDIQMISTELNDGEGLSYIGPNAGDSPASVESYHTFGNNGTTFNTSANSAGNTGLDWIITQGETLPGLNATQTRDAVRNSLARASDHSPLVIDYQLPAILSAVADTVPATLTVGQMFDLDVTISNAASVLASVGADELDYSFSVSGDLTGSGSGIDTALGGGQIEQVTLDTSTAGAKSGTITVTSSSQSVENGTINIPIAWTVLGGIPGDFDMDGDVDADDIDLLAANTGSVPPVDPKFDLDGDNDADFSVSPSPQVNSDSDMLIRTLLSTEYGDANLDGQVDPLDFSILSGNFNTSGGWADGDFNGDGNIDPLDFSILSGNFGFGTSEVLLEANSADGAVPEPSSLFVLALAGMALGCGRCRGARRNRS